MTDNKINYAAQALEKHKEFKGKIEIKSKFGKVESRQDLSVAYTPGVAAVSSFLAQNPDEAKNYSIKGNTIAVVSDGSAVLGLGNIGPLGALPVMEGKALLFKEFAGVDAFPIVLETQDTEEIIRTVKAISPTFGGINLEDISSPRCFEIEERLKAELSIPVFHDDQHGTAIVVLAGLINSLKLAGKNKDNIRVLISGVGAAGVATAKLLTKYGIADIIMSDSKGIVSSDRTDLNGVKQEALTFTNKSGLSGSLKDALRNADVFIGVSGPNLLTAEDVRLMADKAIIFAMANPIPEIMPDEAKKGGAFIVGTGRSDFANQINNVMVFPGLFRGALDHGVRQITDEHKLRAAEAIASYVPADQLSPENILPSTLDKKVAQTVADTIR